MQQGDRPWGGEHSGGSFSDMAKRFIDTDKYKQAMRGLDPKLRVAAYWLWENCDHAGVWKFDGDLFKFECGFALNVEALLKACPWVKRLRNGSLFLVDYIEVNHGKLKPDYNPHKPVFRSLEANGIEPLTLKFEDLPNPCPRVEVVDIDVVESQERKERATEKSDPRFEALWVAYGRIGSKPEALRYWKTLSEEDRAAIEAKLPAYVASTPGGAYRKHLQGWINPKNRLWESAIVTSQPTVKRQMTKAEAMAEMDNIRVRLGIKPGGFIETHLIPKEVYDAFYQRS